MVERVMFKKPTTTSAGNLECYICILKNISWSCFMKYFQIMAEQESFEKLLAARKLLKTCLEKSAAFSNALEKTGSKVKEIQQRLPSLEADIKGEGWRLSSLVDHVDHVIAPVAAVLRVYRSVCELEKSLLSSDECADLQAYISDVKRLQEALKFLSDSCSLTVKWLEDIVKLLRDNGLADDHHYVLNVKKPIRILMDLKAAEARARLRGGILDTAFAKLETEFKRIMEEEGDLPSTPQKLQAIIETLNSNKRLQNCISAYVEVRVPSIRGCFEALGIDYLQKSIISFDDVQDVEGYISQWIKHLELAVKDVYELERRLCNQLFEKAGPEVSLNCFAKIATNSGIFSVLRFGTVICECKKDPTKLLKLLDIFHVLDNLRVQFNRLFIGEPCSKIRDITRDLIRRIVDCTSEIFWELPYQVELQRPTSPPPDGSVPRLVSFVTEYCNQLLGSHYRPILTQILQIHQSWKKEKYHEELLTGQVYNILKEIAMNLDSWSKSYHDLALSYLFMMNNHNHFCCLRETQLGKMMGETWLRAHEQYRDYYVSVYSRESWGKLQGLLNHKRQVVPASPTKRNHARESIKKTLQAFSEAFDEIYTKQSSWIVIDESLRQRLCQVALQAVVPAYKSYLQNSMMLLVEEDHVNPGKYVKYTAPGLESKFKTMLQPKVTKNESDKHSHFVSKVKNTETIQFHLTVSAT